MGLETAAKPLVLVGADDVDFYLLLDHVLKVEGFATLLADDLEETLRLATERTPDIILLDCRPQSYPATEACSRLKQDPQTKATPVIALISPGAERDHVRLLKSGVNESFSRPIVPAKLVEHLRATLGGARPVSNNGLVSYADIEMSLGTYRVRRDGQDIHLSPIEFRLLRHLLQNPEQAITRDELAVAAWRKGVYVSPRTVDVHMGRLRKALKLVSQNDPIRTVRSVGYALVDELDGDGTTNK
jgi:two-component system phosphate regulon response regulator PhoB